MPIRFLLPFLLLLHPLLAADNAQFGQPDCSSPILDKQFFVICYDPAHKIPSWVGYALTPQEARKKTTARQGSFRPDPSLPKGSRAENSDYSGKGFDKGHMAPANDFTRSVAAMRSTFILTNAVPQRPGVNRGKWAQLEGAVHDLTAAQGATWIFTGPVFAGNSPLKSIGPDKVAVPTHTFKVVLLVRENGDKEMFAFVLPNIEKPSGTITDYTFSVNQVEKLTGLNFFNAIPSAEQSKLERAINHLPQP
jgi:endonuclease G